MDLKPISIGPKQLDFKRTSIPMSYPSSSHILGTRVLTSFVTVVMALKLSVGGETQGP
jgi:hypothetical protein